MSEQDPEEEEEQKPCERIDPDDHRKLTEFTNE
jgi:hypothetical protein